MLFLAVAAVSLWVTPNKCLSSAQVAAAYNCFKETCHGMIAHFDMVYLQLNLQ